MEQGRERSEVAVARAADRVPAGARVLLDHIQLEAVLVLDRGGKIAYCNGAAQAIVGWPEPLLIGAAVAELCHPDDRDQLGSPAEATTFTVRLRDQARAYRSFAASRVALGDGVGMVLAPRERAERHRIEHALEEKERAYANLLGNLNGMAYRCRNDADWTMDLVSDGCRAVTGYPADALRMNRDVAFGDLIHPDDAGPLWEKCQANLAARRVCNNEYRIRDKAGTWRWVVDVAHGVYGEAGELVAIEGFITDVTARKDLEAQLASARSLESLGRLAGGVAHDFNNLLMAIGAYARFVVGDLPPDHGSQEDLGQIIEAVQRASDLTAQLLAVARRTVIVPRVIDLNALVLGIDKLLRRTLGENLELVTVVGPEPLPAYIDPGQVEQMLLNLAVNARDAIAGHGSLTITCARVEVDGELPSWPDRVPAGRFVCLGVADNGCGMTAEVLERCFEPFFTTKEAGQGTGLGLATCYGIARQAGGYVSVESRPGVGTRFAIYLPHSDQAIAPIGADPVVLLRGCGETVLLVEDHAMVRDATARVLRDLGYRVLVARGGVEAFALAASEAGPIDLLVTDVVMPDTCGPDLAARLRQARSELRVLFISGFSEGGGPALDGEPWASFLGKPFSASALATQLRALLDV